MPKPTRKWHAAPPRRSLARAHAPLGGAAPSGGGNVEPEPDALPVEPLVPVADPLVVPLDPLFEPLDEPLALPVFPDVLPLAGPAATPDDPVPDAGPALTPDDPLVDPDASCEGPFDPSALLPQPARTNSAPMTPRADFELFTVIIDA